MSTYLLVGCGKMGGALLAGWLDRGIAPGDVTVVEPGAELGRGITVQHGVRVVGGADALGAGFTADGRGGGFTADVAVFAVKPQSLGEVAGQYRGLAEAGAVFLSIAAGKPIAFFEAALGASAAIVRTMPNTPAAVRRGITAAFANANVSDAQRALCQSLLEAVGEVVWVDDEALLDPVTAVSGSGPAYVFLMIECLAQAGVAEGLPPDIAQRLARATVIGSGELARQSPDPAEMLRQNVTSPGGTTEAALAVLMADDGLAPLMRRAVAAANRRSRELAG